MKAFQIFPDVPLLRKLYGGMSSQNKRANQERGRKARNTGVSTGGKDKKGNSQGAGGGRPQADTPRYTQKAAIRPERSERDCFSKWNWMAGTFQHLQRRCKQSTRIKLVISP